MKFFEETVYTRTTRSVTVEGGPALSKVYGDKSGRVDTVHIHYRLVGRNSEWIFDHAVVTGPVLKQDQTDSKNRFDTSVYRHEIDRLPARWGWLGTLIDQARPTSSPVFPSSFEGKEV